MKIPALRFLAAGAAIGGAVLTGAPLAAQDPATATEADPPPIYTEVVDVRVINVDVVVTDRSGKSIVGLEPQDFELRVDGEPMPISNFYAEQGGFVGRVTGTTDRPAQPADSEFRSLEEVRDEAPRRAHVVILVDHTRLRPTNRTRAFNALREVLDSLGSEDLIAVVGVESSLVFYSDFLYDRRAVNRILDDLTGVSAASDNINAMERRQIFGELARGMSGGIQARASLADESSIMSRIRAYAEQEYQRSLSSLRQIETVVSTLSGLPGRKALLYVGEGIPTRPGEGLYVEWRNRFGGGNPDADIGLRRFDFNTDYTREVGRYDLTQPVIALSRSANRSGVSLYAIDAEGNHGAEIRSALTEQGATSETLSVVDENFRAPLEAATKATGGRLLRSSGLLADQLLDVVGDLQTFYSLGFTAPDGWQSGTDHKIEVKVKGQKFVVRHREEVRLPDADEVEASATVAALMYQAANNPLEIRGVTGETFQREDGAIALRVDLEIPVAKLAFLPGNETQAGSLTIYVTKKGADGNPSQVQKIPFHLNIPDEAMEQAMNDSARYPLPVVLQPGDQQVAIGVRDDVNGIFSAIRLDVAEFSRF